MRMSALLALVAALTLGASPALAQKKRGPGKPSAPVAAEQCKEFEGDEAEGCKVIGAYLDLWKQQKWAELKKLIHPKTVEKIATVKKNVGEERHNMAPWYWVKDTYLLKEWKVESLEGAAMGTVVLNTVEDTYRVEEDGIAEADPASYLAGKFNGKWYVVERRGGGGGFDKTGIEIGMKGYFDEPAGGTAEKSVEK